MASRRQRETRQRRARKHAEAQWLKKNQAMSEASEAARTLGSNGVRLKKERTGKALQDAFRREMEKRGYVSDGRGGWRVKLDASPGRVAA